MICQSKTQSLFCLYIYNALTAQRVKLQKSNMNFLIILFEIRKKTICKENYRISFNNKYNSNYCMLVTIENYINNLQEYVLYTYIPKNLYLFLKNISTNTYNFA